MTIKSNPCKLCRSTYHTAAFCPTKPRKTIKRVPVKNNIVKTKVKKQSRSQLVKKLDAIFSQYIRLSESVDGIGTCVTCGTSKPWKEMQNGHFFTRGRYATRWDVTNCHIQDAACNVFLKGNYIKYTTYMIDRYGREAVDELEFKSLNGAKISTVELREMIELYRGKVNEMLKEY